MSLITEKSQDVYKRQGLNMERPDLKRMLKAIERRQINLVITKDLSRLGRNYLQTGTLIAVSYTHLDVYKRQGVFQAAFQGSPEPPL